MNFFLQFCLFLFCFNVFTFRFILSWNFSSFLFFTHHYFFYRRQFKAPSIKYNNWTLKRSEFMLTIGGDSPLRFYFISKSCSFHNIKLNKHLPINQLNRNKHWRLYFSQAFLSIGRFYRLLKSNVFNFYLDQTSPYWFFEPAWASSLLALRREFSGRRSKPSWDGAAAGGEWLQTNLGWKCGQPCFRVKRNVYLHRCRLTLCVFGPVPLTQFFVGGASFLCR